METVHEEWRPVKGWEGLYEVSSVGRVRSLDRIVEDRLRHSGRVRKFAGRILRCQRDIDGYLIVSLTNKHRVVVAKCHRMVAEAFIGDGRGLQVNHKNFDKSDNRVENLEWTTPTQNTRHALLACRSRTENHSPGCTRAKLTIEQVKRIKELLKSGATGSSVAKMFGISDVMASRIKRGVSWAFVETVA